MSPCHITHVIRNTRIPKERLRVAEDSEDPRLIGLGLTAEGTRLFAADGNNKAIKCVDLRTLSVHNAYKAARYMRAVLVLSNAAQKV